MNRYEEPVVSIRLFLRHRPVRFPAVIDTGFNGYLSVPKRLLARGRWEAIGTEKFEIATESRDILIGTKLLRGKVLLVNFRSKRVTVK